MDYVIVFLLGIAVTVAASLLLRRYTSFIAQRPADYAESGPAFDLKTHLNGPILCEGVIYGPTGRVSSRFVADFDARWDGDRGVMDEHFRYDAGTTQDRQWRLSFNADGTIRAEADDLVGPGHGVQDGPGLQLRYRIRLPEASGGHVLDVVDWMYLMENGAIMNRSQFFKFGIKVAELVATMRPRAEAAAVARPEAANEGEPRARLAG